MFPHGGRFSLPQSSVSAVDLYWHPDHFRCSQCATDLTKGESILCEEGGHHVRSEVILCEEGGHHVRSEVILCEEGGHHVRSKVILCEEGGHPM